MLLVGGTLFEEVWFEPGSPFAAGVQVIVLLALSDEGAPGYEHDNAAALAGLGVTAFACTPDAFPDLMAAAIERRDITQWAQHHHPSPT